MFGTPFEMFGTVHLITIATVIVISVLLPKFYKNKTEDQKSTMSKIIAAITATDITLPQSLCSCVMLIVFYYPS